MREAINYPGVYVLCWVSRMTELGYVDSSIRESKLTRSTRTPIVLSVGETSFPC